MQIDNLKKALAAKEGAKILSSQKQERSKYAAEITPPRLRRLSIENSSVRKSVIATNAEDKKVLKSPLPRPRLRTEHGSIRSWGLSSEGSFGEKEEQVAKNSAPSVS